MTKQRLIFIDVTRISALTLVILQHLLVWKWNGYSFLQPYAINGNIANIFLIEWGYFGVLIFIFISGCSLALSHNTIDTRSKLLSFYKSRLLRIYPAFWIACLLNLIVFYTKLPDITLIDYVKDLSGFQAFGALSYNDFVGMINGAYWFIGVIISLYFMFPLIMWFMQRHPHLTIIILGVVSLVSRIVMSYGFPQFYRGTDWNPLCQIFFFGLGIYLIKLNRYPHYTTNNRAITFLGQNSFYIYLVHAPLLPFMVYDSPILFFVCLSVFSVMLFWFDKQIRRYF